MSLFKEKEESTLYHVYTGVSALEKASDAELEKWGSDPNCIERETCADYLAKRLTDRTARAVAKVAMRAAKRQELQDNPFDPRTEISADAEHIADRIVKQASVDAEHIAARIVKHLWIIFVLLPIVIGILYELLK